MLLRTFIYTSFLVGICFKFSWCMPRCRTAESYGNSDFYKGTAKLFYQSIFLLLSVESSLHIMSKESFCQISDSKIFSFIPFQVCLLQSKSVIFRFKFKISIKSTVAETFHESCFGVYMKSAFPEVKDFLLCFLGEVL